MQKQLFHPSKGILSPAGKKFSPLKGVEHLYADQNGKKHTLDGTEVPVDHIMKAHEENQNTEKQKESDFQKEWKKIEEEEITKITGQDKILHQEQEKQAKHKDILSEIKNASDAIVEAVEAIPETVIPEYPDHYKEQAVWQAKVLESLKLEFPETDMQPVVDAIRGIKFPEFPTPINYTAALEAIKKALPKERDNSDLILAIQSIKFPEFPEQPQFKFNKNGSLKVAVDEMAVSTGGGGDTSKLATEETLQKIRAGVSLPGSQKIIDESGAPATTIITYKFNGETLAVDTIEVSGAITTITTS